jgi:hypothetical protein
LIRGFAGNVRILLGCLRKRWRMIAKAQVPDFDGVGSELLKITPVESLTG